MRTFPSRGGSPGVKKWPSLSFEGEKTQQKPSGPYLQRGARRWVRTHSPFTVGLILFLSSFIHISFSTPLASFPAERHISQNIYQLCLKKYVLVLLLWISLVLVFSSLSSSLPRVLLGVICAQELRSDAPPVIIHMLRVCACACACVCSLPLTSGTPCKTPSTWSKLHFTVVTVE